MENEIAKKESFEEKMKARIKDSIGELITDEELSLLVKRSLDEVFFKPIKIRDPAGGCYANMIDGPSLLNGIIKELLSPKVLEIVCKYIDENGPEVISAIKLVTSQGIGQAILFALNNRFSSDMFAFQQMIEDRLRK